MDGQAIIFTTTYAGLARCISIAISEHAWGTMPISIWHDSVAGTHTVTIPQDDSRVALCRQFAFGFVAGWTEMAKQWREAEKAKSPD